MALQSLALGISAWLLEFWTCRWDTGGSPSLPCTVSLHIPVETPLSSILAFLSLLLPEAMFIKGVPSSSFGGEWGTLESNCCLCRLSNHLPVFLSLATHPTLTVADASSSWCLWSPAACVLLMLLCKHWGLTHLLLSDAPHCLSPHFLCMLWFRAIRCLLF